MYDGKNIKIHFFAKDNPNCSALYCLQLVSLFCCDTCMPNGTCVLCHWADNGLAVIQQIILHHSRTFEQLQEIQSFAGFSTHCSNMFTPGKRTSKQHSK